MSATCLVKNDFPFLLSEIEEYCSFAAEDASSIVQYISLLYSNENSLQHLIVARWSQLSLSDCCWKIDCK